MLPQPASVRNRLRGYTVLVVEDEYLIAYDIADALQREGARALGPLSTVGGAVRVVDSSAVIDAAVLGLSIRGEMVWPVVDLLLGRNLPVVFVSGYGAASLPERYRRVPCCDKPVSMAMLVQSVLRAISA